MHEVRIRADRITRMTLSFIWHTIAIELRRNFKNIRIYTYIEPNKFLTSPNDWGKCWKHFADVAIAHTVYFHRLFRNNNYAYYSVFSLILIMHIICTVHGLASQAERVCTCMCVLTWRCKQKRFTLSLLHCWLVHHQSKKNLLNNSHWTRGQLLRPKDNLTARFTLKSLEEITKLKKEMKQV